MHTLDITDTKVLICTIHRKEILASFDQEALIKDIRMYIDQRKNTSTMPIDFLINDLRKIHSTNIDMLKKLQDELGDVISKNYYHEKLCKSINKLNSPPKATPVKKELPGFFSFLSRS